MNYLKTDFLIDSIMRLHLLKESLSSPHEKSLSDLYFLQYRIAKIGEETNSKNWDHRSACIDRDIAFKDFEIMSKSHAREQQRVKALLDELWAGRSSLAEVF